MPWMTTRPSLKGGKPDCRGRRRFRRFVSYDDAENATALYDCSLQPFFGGEERPIFDEPTRNGGSGWLDSVLYDDEPLVGDPLVEADRFELQGESDAAAGPA